MNGRTAFPGAHMQLLPILQALCSRPSPTARPSSSLAAAVIGPERIAVAKMVETQQLRSLSEARPMPLDSALLPLARETCWRSHRILLLAIIYPASPG